MLLKLKSMLTRRKPPAPPIARDPLASLLAAKQREADSIAHMVVQAREALDRAEQEFEFAKTKRDNAVQALRCATEMQGRWERRNPSARVEADVIPIRSSAAPGRRA